jgi:uncharacterized protein YqjF (DUF2071 family)
MTQRWSDIIWAHWPVGIDQVAPLLPPGLTPETFGGDAWVGLVPFAMSNLRMPGALAPVSSALGASSFGEVNVRTYVRGPDGQTGVWFATLDADSRLATAVARIVLGLPYRHATTRLVTAAAGRDGQLAWTSERHHDQARSQLHVTPQGTAPRPAEAGLEHFLVERYSLYSWWHGRLLRGSLSHPPWQVRHARLDHVDAGIVASAGFTVVGAPHVLVGDPVDVRVHPFGRTRPQIGGKPGRAAIRRPPASKGRR